MNVVLTALGEKQFLKVKLAMSVTDNGVVRVKVEEEDPRTCSETLAKYECVISNPVDTACGVHVGEMVEQTKAEDVKLKLVAVGREQQRVRLAEVQVLVTTCRPDIGQSENYLATMGRAEHWLQQLEHNFFHNDLDECNM